MTSVEGFGLHSGHRARVTFALGEGPVRIHAGDVDTRIDELVPDGAARSTMLRTSAGKAVVATVEHLFAALEARSIRDGLTITIDGPELPLLDGGARAYVDALAAFDLPPLCRRVVARPDTFTIGASTYRFVPGDRVRVAVAIDFDDARIAPAASWDGDADDFRDRIAPARTFGFAHELGELLDRRLANHVTPESVVVFAADAVLSAGAPFHADEPARHKLLDLLGDLYVHGGAPRGEVHATRPGHAATHAAMRWALETGVIVTSG